MRLMRDEFERSHFEIGSGATLQPLLRFSDLTDEFIFVDYMTSGEEAKDQLLSAATALGRWLPEGAAPLQLLSLDYHPRLDWADFELCGQPRDAAMQVWELMTPSEQRGYQHYAGLAAGADQWGIEAKFVRRIEALEGGQAIERPLRLRIFGGEGLISYVAMGGCQHPPRQVGTVQTGLMENSNGPLARLFAKQAATGGALPGAWIRGCGWLPWFRRQWGGWDRALEPAEPFSVVGQRYSHWVGDRDWPSAPWRGRLVTGWVRDQGPEVALTVGDHQIVPRALGPEEAASLDLVLGPRRIDPSVGGHKGYDVVKPNRGDLLPPLAEQLTAWSNRLGFHGANRVGLVPVAYEDEIEVLVDWLRNLNRPQVTVFIPMALDFAAAKRAVSSALST